MRHLVTFTLTAVILSSSILSATAAAQSTDWKLSAQLRPRMEFRHGYRTLLPEPASGVIFFSQRARVGVLYNGDPKIKAFLQLQDVRTWGDETSTSADATADKFDLHQGYLDLLPNAQWTLRIGRQEIQYDEDRLLGNGNWNQPGRAHDAIRLMWRNGPRSAHLAWAHHEKGEPTNWGHYPYDQNYQDLLIGRVEQTWQDGGGSILVIFDSYDIAALPDADRYRVTGLPPNRWTGGLYIKQRLLGLDWRGEGYYQTGKYEIGPSVDVPNGSRHDIDAYMFGASVGRDLGAVRVTGWYDHLSGDDHRYDDRFAAFNPLYGTFHRFYGWADYFISIPGDTRGLGLQDLALKLTVDAPRSSSAQIDLHYFWLARRGEFESAKLGFEGDAMVSIPLGHALSFQCGYSLVLPSATLEELKSNVTVDDAGHWLWTMLDFNIP